MWFEDRSWLVIACTMLVTLESTLTISAAALSKKQAQSTIWCWWWNSGTCTWPPLPTPNIPTLTSSSAFSLNSYHPKFKTHSCCSSPFHSLSVRSPIKPQTWALPSARFTISFTSFARPHSTVPLIAKRAPLKFGDCSVSSSSSGWTMHPFNSFTYMCIYRSSLMTVILFPNKFFLLLSLIKLYTSTHSFIHPIFSFIRHPINSFRLVYVMLCKQARK